MIRRTAAVALVVAVLGGCSWIYDSPYEDALHTRGSVPPPPNANGQRDLEAALPYDQSPWFDEDRMAVSPDGYYDPE